MAEGTTRTGRRSLSVVAWAILLGIAATVLIVACHPQPDTGPTDAIPGMRATATALVMQRLPTLEARMTAVSGMMVGHNSPTPAANSLPTTSSADAATETTPNPSSANPTSAAPPTALPSVIVPTGTPASNATQPSIAPTFPGQVYFDGGDEHDTVLVDSIRFGQAINGELNMPFDAHNWLIEGTEGQTLTIWAHGVGEMDPVLSLIGPDGNLLFENDDSSGYDAVIVATLPTSGTYTIRVKAWVVGNYTLTVE